MRTNCGFDEFPDPKKGKKVFDRLRKAVKELSRIDPAAQPGAADAIDDLVAITRQLAVAAIGDNPPVALDDSRQGKVNREWAKANEDLAKGDSEPKSDKTLKHYERAWEHAQKASKEAAKAP